MAVVKLRDKLTVYGDAPLYNLGDVTYDISGNKYVYYLLSASAAADAAANDVMYHDGTTWGTVIEDISATKQNLVAGIAIAAIPSNTDSKAYYAWFQVDGYHLLKIPQADTGTKGDSLIGNATANGSCAVVTEGTAPTHRMLGVLFADNASGTATAGCILCLGG